MSNTTNLTALSINVTALRDNINHFWTLINGIIVVFMACGFALREAGLVGAKNVVSTCVRNLVDHNLFGVIFYWVFGYAFAFGVPGMFFSGYWWFALSYIPDTEFSKFVFHYALASIVPLIVSGAVAERVRFECYLVFSALCSAFIYPICSHWQWTTTGWLYLGIDRDNALLGPQRLQDLAGSVAIHTLGGTMALVAAFLVGPRGCRQQPYGGWKLLPSPPGHNVLLTTVGTLMLSFSFLCFNEGSVTSMSDEGMGTQAGRAVVNTLLSMAGANLCAMVLSRALLDRKWGCTRPNAASLAGLVAACSGCNVFDPWAAFVTGLFAGGSYILVAFLVRLAQIDDPVEAVGVHLGGGICGAIFSALLDRNNGIIFNWTGRSFLYLLWQVVGISSAILWGVIWAVIIFGPMRILKIIRPNPEVELKGLDVYDHGEQAYPPSAYVDGWQEMEEEPKSMFSGYALDTLPQSESSLVIATSVVPVNAVTTAVPMHTNNDVSQTPGMSPGSNVSGGAGDGMRAVPALPSMPPPRLEVGTNEAAVDVGEVVRLGGVSENEDKGYVNPVASVETGECTAPLPASAIPRTPKSVDQLDHKF